MRKMRTALITEANKGIGLEMARKLVNEGFFVYMGSRDLQQGIEAVKKLAAEGLGTVDVVQLDVSNQLSVDAARKEIGVKIDALDVLINNAGIIGDIPQSALAFSDLMRKSPKPRVVNVTCGLASQAVASDQCAKTALNRYTINLAYDLRETNFKVSAVDPGLINIDFDNSPGTGTIEDAGNRIVKYALI